MDPPDSLSAASLAVFRVDADGLALNGGRCVAEHKAADYESHPY